MFRILDRYLLKNFLFSFVLFFVIILALLTVVQVATDLDEFTELSEQGYSSWEIASIVARFSLFNLPKIFYHFSPYITLMSALFTVARLQKNNELTPMKAAGISAYRIFLPFLVWSGLVTVAAVLDQEILIPRLGLDLRRLDEFRSGRITDRRPYPRKIDSLGNEWSARWYRVDLYRLLEVTFETPMTPEGKVVLVARRAQWHSGKDTGESSYWMFEDVVRFQHGPRGAPILHTVGTAELPFTSHHKIRIPSTGEPTVSAPVSGLVPDDLTEYSRNSLESELLSYGEIVDRMEEQLGDIKGLSMQRHRRFAHPLANIVLLMLGLPLVVHRDKKQMAFGILVAVALCIMFESMTIICQSLVYYKKFVTPALCAWLPILVFAPLAVYLFDSMET